MIPSQVLDHWRHAIVADPIMAQRALARLEREAHPDFVALCHLLADDADVRVRQIAVRQLGQRGDSNDPRAEASALTALAEPALLNTALWALGKVGTRRAFPILLTYARNRSVAGLAGASNIASTVDEVQEVLQLARHYILLPGSAGFYLREESVRILLRHSTAMAEQHILLQSARLYADEMVIWALRAITSDIVDEVKDMRAQYPEDCAEYKDFSRTIDVLEQRTAASNDGLH